jgi:hypothetical protein
MEILYRVMFLWIVFAVALGGKNWTFPYGIKGAISSVREHDSSQISRQNHFAFHALNR